MTDTPPPLPQFLAPGDDAPERDPECEAAVPMVVLPDEMALMEALAAAAMPEHDEGLAAVPAPPQPDEAPPVPMFAGTYAVYEDGHGGVVLVLAQSTGDTVRKHIPAQMIKLAEKFSGGGPLGALGSMFGGR